MELLRCKKIEDFKNALNAFESSSLGHLKSDEGYSIMQHAVLNDKCEFVNALLDYDVDPNIGSRERPLLIAAENGFHKILETFLDLKRNVRFDECNLAGENILHLGIMPNI